MDEHTHDIDPYLAQLILSLQAGAMQQMGKIASPVSGKVERNLEVARLTIDTLSMLEAKTKGNLSADEAKFIGHVLYELRLNYVDEVKKEGTGAAGADKEAESETSAEAAPDSESENASSAEKSDTGETGSGEEKPGQ